MGTKLCPSGVVGSIISAILVLHIWFLPLCHGHNLTDNNGSKAEIDYETLSLYGFTPELADQFRINLIKAIEAARNEADKVDPLRQAEFGGEGNNQEEEEEEEEEEPVVTTPGPGAFGVLSGLFGIFSGLAGLNPSRIVQSTVNFFPPGQRTMAQKVVDSLIGYTPQQNRTARPRPRTRRPLTSTPMVISEAMMKEVTEASATNTMVQKGNETSDGVQSNSSSIGLTMSEMVETVLEPTTTQSSLLNKNRTTSLPQDQDDETDFEKAEKEITITEKIKTNSSMAIYKLRVRVPEMQIETGDVVDEQVNASNTTLSNATTTIP